MTIVFKGKLSKIFSLNLFSNLHTATFVFMSPIN